MDYLVLPNVAPHGKRAADMDGMDRDLSALRSRELEHVVAPTLHLAHERERPTARAWFGRERQHVGHLVADERLGVVEQIRYEQLVARRPWRNGMIRLVDGLEYREILVQVEASMLRTVRPDDPHFGHPVAVEGRDAPSLA